MNWKIVLNRVATIGLVGLALISFSLIAMILALTHPSRAVVTAPTDLSAQDIILASASGVMLKGWYLAGAPDKGGIVLMHGIGGNRLAMIARMRFLHDAGYHVLAFDFRAHGESTGDEVTFGLSESEDAKAAVAWLRQVLPGRKIGAIGASLGGAAALLSDPPLDLDALVLESVYPDIDRAIDDRLLAALGPIGHAVTPALLAIGQVMTGLEPARLRPIDGLKRVKAPVFVISGTADRNTRIEETREMFARANEPKQLWEVDGVGHADIYFHTNETYRERIRAFFKRTL